jgi:RHS repeat-associated protein
MCGWRASCWLTNPSRTLVWDREQEPFGETYATPTNTTPTTHRFPGQIYDSENGLFYNNMRDYDPTLGFYIQADPIGQRGGLNPYAYVGQNQTQNIDPTGLQTAPLYGPGVLPIVISPFAIPGTPEHKQWTQWSNANIVAPIQSWWDNYLSK